MEGNGNYSIQCTILTFSLCGAGLEYLHRRPQRSKRKGKGKQCLGVKLGHLVPGGHKYKHLIPKFGAWTQAEDVIQYK